MLSIRLELTDLLTTVACQLTAKNVTLILKKPKPKKATGMAYQVTSGTYVIELDPNRSLEAIVRTLLHEIEHIRSGAADETPPVVPSAQDLSLLEDIEAALAGENITAADLFEGASHPAFEVGADTFSHQVYAKAQRESAPYRAVFDVSGVDDPEAAFALLALAQVKLNLILEGVVTDYFRPDNITNSDNGRDTKND